MNAATNGSSFLTQAQFQPALPDAFTDGSGRTVDGRQVGWAGALARFPTPALWPFPLEAYASTAARDRGFHREDYLLSLEELEQKAAARVHPSRRR
jgi:hypothetical protein